MLKRSRPVSLPPSFIPPIFSGPDISSLGRHQKRMRTTSTATPSEYCSMSVNGWSGHGHGYHSASSLSKRRRSIDREVEDMSQDDRPTTSLPKRRRTTAPSLDGKLRGWNPPVPSLLLTSEVYEDAEKGNGEDWKSQAGEYRDANILLHDLHEIHLHRVNSPFPRPSSSAALEDQESSSQDLDSDMGDEELRLVKEQYEEPNKLLGSLFLSRRRDLSER